MKLLCPKCKEDVTEHVTLKCVGEFTITQMAVRSEKVKVADHPEVVAITCHGCGYEGEPEEFGYPAPTEGQLQDAILEELTKHRTTMVTLLRKAGVIDK